MTIKNELMQYAKKSISQQIPSGKKHVQACQRFLYDLKREKTEDFPYYFDEKEAQGIVKWFTYLKHSKGVLAGQFIKLTTWQKFCLCQIYGWRNVENGYKRFTKSFIEVGRKNAKSQMEAGVCLYEMSTQATKNKEIYECYTAGTKRQQSKIILEEAKNMLKGSPLSPKFQVTRDRITHIKTGSYLQALCKEDGQKGDGTNPAVLVLDEYHQHQTTEFYDLGLGSNTKEYMLMIITTAGMNLNYPCYTEEYSYCSKILDPDIDVENVSYFVDIMESDDGDDISDVKTWKKANPIRASYSEGVKKIREDYEIACEVPEKLTAFMTKCLNKWVQAQESGYMDMAKWKKCEVKALPYDLKGQPVYVGFDMSAKIDLTSVAFIVPILSNERDSINKPIIKYVCFSHSFVPNREKLIERKAKDKVPYDAWERNGYLTVTESEIVDQSVVMQYVLKTCEENDWKIQRLCFDPANASKLMMDISNDGYDVVEVYQSYKSLNESTSGFREQVYEGNVIYLPNPLLNFAMSNAVIKNNDGLIKIDKGAAAKRIDPVDAMLCAYKLALYHDFDFDSGAVDDWLSSEW